MRKLALLVIACLCFSAQALAAGNTMPEAQVKAGAFIWQGLVDGPAPYYGLDVSVKITESVFVPMGYSRYDGTMDTSGGEEPALGEISLHYQSATLGLGYLARPSRSVEIPVGFRLGWGKMTFEYDDELFAAMNGKSLEPFLGLRWNVTSRLSIGEESRLVLFMPNKTGSDDDDDEKDDDDKEKKTVGIPQAHMLTLSYALGDAPRRPASTAKAKGSRGSRAAKAPRVAARD